MFGEEADNDAVFEATRQQVEGCLEGYNLTLLAYGVTGSGKTHTIFGNDTEEGLAIRYCRQLFASSPQEVRFSYMEIYNENVRDLLADGAKSLAVLEDGGRTVVPELGEFAVGSDSEVAALIRQGNSRRVRGATNINEASSRSHAILQFTVTSRRGEQVLQSRLNVIDLAGSERVFHNESEKMVLEGSNINRSLLALGNCITALSERKGNAHVPYRDSKLTRILKETLAGNSRSIMFACLSCSPSQYDETISTIHYASRASRIRKKPTRNLKDSGLVCPRCHHCFDAPRPASGTAPRLPKTAAEKLVQIDFQELRQRLGSLIDQSLLIGRHSSSQDGLYDVSILESVFESNRTAVFARIEELAAIQESASQPKQHAETSPSRPRSKPSSQKRHRERASVSEALPTLASPEKENNLLHINLRDLPRRSTFQPSLRPASNPPQLFSRRSSRQASDSSECTPTLRMKRDSLEEGASPSRSPSPSSQEAEFPELPELPELPACRFRSARLSLLQPSQPSRKLRLM